MKKYYLMAPGPTPVPSNVLLAMAEPILHHRTPEYEALFLEVRAGLKRLFQTSQDVIPFTSSGTGALEAAVCNTLSAGDAVLVLRAGKFGERWSEICRAYGVTVIPMDALRPHRAGSAFAEVLRRHPDVKAVRCSSEFRPPGYLTSVRRGVAPRDRRDRGRGRGVELGIADLRMDEWAWMRWSRARRRA
jgi:aspartate aminotransferase-like enzyme